MHSQLDMGNGMSGYLSVWFYCIVNTLLIGIFHTVHVVMLYNTVFNPYPTAFPYGNGMVLHFYQQQESSTTKTVHKVINKELKAYV